MPVYLKREYPYVSLFGALLLEQLQEMPGLQAPWVEHQGWSSCRRRHGFRHQDRSTMAGAAAGGARAVGTSAVALGLEQQPEVGKFPMIMSQ